MKRTIRITLIVGIMIIFGLIVTSLYKHLLIGTKGRLDKVYVVVIDTSGKLDLKEDDILLGSDPILLRMRESQGEASPLIQVLSFENITQLLGFDENNHGYIDMSNPIFSQLYVASLDEQHKKLEKLSLKKAGFIAIAFEPDFINAALSDKINQFGDGVGNIVQQRNRRLDLKLIQINVTQLNELVNAEENESNDDSMENKLTH